MAEYKIARPRSSDRLPSKEDLKLIEVITTVKLKFTQKGKIGELMWVQVSKILKNGWMEARVDNEPINLDLKLDDIIKFHITDVLEVLHPSIDQSITNPLR